MKKALYHEDSGLYLEKMRMAFQEHYEKRTDMWSTDPSLTDAAVMSLKAWRSREKNALASVLDIGCGNGRVLEHLSGLSEYVGIDLYEHEEWEGLQKREKRSLSILFIKILCLGQWIRGEKCSLI